MSLLRFFFCLSLALLHIRDFTFYQEAIERWHPYFGWPYRSVPKLAHFYLEWNQILGIAFIGFLVLSALGVASRFSLALSCLLYFLYQAPLQTYFVYHDQNVHFWILLILALSPGVCHWTLLKNRKNEAKAISSWPFLAFQLVFASVFFGAGLCKVMDAGLIWANGETLQFWLVCYKLWFKADLGFQLAQYSGLCAFLSALILFFELSFPLALIKNRLFPYYLGFSFFFISCVYLLMDISFFRWFAIAYLPFVPWAKFLTGEVKQSKAALSRGAQLVLSALALLQLIPVTMRANAFPLTDYEIFSKHYSIKQFWPIYRLSSGDIDGPFLRDTEWYEIHYSWDKEDTKGRGRGLHFLKDHMRSLGLTKATLVRTRVTRNAEGRLELINELVKRITLEES